MTDNPMFRARVEAAAKVADRFAEGLAKTDYALGVIEGAMNIRNEILRIPPPSPHTDEGQADSAHPAIPADDAKRAHEVLCFLKGSGELDGIWFGQGEPKYWWRKHLDVLATAYTPVIAHPVAGDDEARAREAYAQAFERAGNQHAADCIRDAPAKAAARECYGLPLHYAETIDAMLAFARTRLSAVDDVGERERIARIIFEATPDRFLRVAQCYPAADAILATRPSAVSEVDRLIADIDIEMSGRDPEWADVRGKLLFRARALLSPHSDMGDTGHE